MKGPDTPTYEPLILGWCLTSAPASRHGVPAARGSCCTHRVDRAGVTAWWGLASAGIRIASSGAGAMSNRWVLFSVRRLGSLLLTLMVLLIVTFSVVHLTPGDPARLVLGPLVAHSRPHSRAQLGLDLPLVDQLWRYSRECPHPQLRDVVPDPPARHDGAPRTAALYVVAGPDRSRFPHGVRHCARTARRFAHPRGMPPEARVRLPRHQWHRVRYPDLRGGDVPHSHLRHRSSCTARGGR